MQQCRLAAKGAAGCPRGHYRLVGSVAAAASLALITLRSRPLLLRIWPGFGLSTLPLRVAAWRADNLFTKNTASTPPHRPIEFLANNFFDCRHRGSLASCLYASQ